MQKICATCFYDTGKACKILHEKIPENCYAWADELEAKRREKAIKNYIDPEGNTSGRKIPKDMISQRTRVRAENLKKRGGKSVKEVLDEHFLDLYNQDISDTAIGQILGIDTSKVYDYRRSKKLPAQNKKDRPTAMEAAI